MPEANAIAALATEGIEVLGPIGPQYDEILTPEALRFVASLQRTFGARREELLARRVEAQKKIDSGVLPDFLPETEEIRKGDWKVAAIPHGARGPARRDHRTGREEDGHQRPQLGGERLPRRLRGRELAHLGELRRGAAQPPRRHRRDDRLPRPRDRQGIPAEREDRDPHGEAARLAPPREAPPRRREALLGEPLRLRPLLLPLRQAAPREGGVALLLPPEARAPPRGAPLERRLREGAEGPRHPERDDPRDRPHRDDHGRLPDGRDPLGAEGPLGAASTAAAGTTSSRSSRGSGAFPASSSPTAAS